MFRFFSLKNRQGVLYGYLNQKGPKKFLFGKSFNSELSCNETEFQKLKQNFAACSVVDRIKFWCHVSRYSR